MREPMLLPAEERGETLPHVLRNQSEQNPMRQRMNGTLVRRPNGNGHYTKNIIFFNIIGLKTTTTNIIYEINIHFEKKNMISLFPS